MRASDVSSGERASERFGTLARVMLHAHNHSQKHASDYDYDLLLTFAQLNENKFRRHTPVV